MRALEGSSFNISARIMKTIIVYSVCCIILLQTSFGQLLREAQAENGDIQASGRFGVKDRRGVTYIKPPSTPPRFIPDEHINSNSPERRNRNKLKYDIFEKADERPGSKPPSSPVTSKPSTNPLPPGKFGPVLFPDEEATASGAQNNGNNNNNNKSDGKGNQSSQNGGSTGSLTNPPQNQRNNSKDGNRNNNGNNQREGTVNTSQTGSNSNRRSGRPQNNRNRNNGRGQSGGRRA